jgi:hypothetical protein
MMQLTAPVRDVLPRETLLVDRYVPDFDARLAQHGIVDADVRTTWDALFHLDLMRVHTPLLDLAFWARALPAKLRRIEQPAPPALVLGDPDVSLPGWLTLGVDAGHELALGAIGRFWTPTIVWHDVDDPEAFRTFAEPGWGRIGVSFSVRPYGEHRALLSYECRTVTTDDCSREAFAVYWAVIRHFVAHIMRATVRTVADDARARSMASDPQLPGGLR